MVLVGPLSDLWGRRQLLLIGIAISVIGAAGCVMTPDYGWFLVFRVVQAIGCGSFVLSQALIQDLFVGREQ
ncbi:Inner membrane transport protein YdhC [compost metagenome]